MRPFRCATAVHSGARIAADLGGHVAGRRPLLVSSPGWLRRGLAETVGRQVAGSLCVADPVGPHPRLADLVALERALPAFDAVVAVGGGSVIDAAKAVVALRALGGDAGRFRDHLLGAADLPPSLGSAPIVAVPTTSGSGSEVTPWATVWGDGGEKRSVAHADLLPRAALLDPTLCVGMPDAVTVATGLDALSHAMEAVWNVNASPATDFIAAAAIRGIKDGLPEALAHPRSVEARQGVQIAALHAGLAMATTQTALAHSISYRLTALFGFPHGLASGLTLGEVARFNAGEDPGRVAVAAAAFGCGVDDLPDRLHGWMGAIGVPGHLRAHVAAGRGAGGAGLGDDLVDSPRASNNVRRADGPAARAIVKASLRALLGGAP